MELGHELKDMCFCPIYDLALVSRRWTPDTIGPMEADWKLLRIKWIGDKTWDGRDVEEVTPWLLLKGSL